MSLTGFCAWGLTRPESRCSFLSRGSQFWYLDYWFCSLSHPPFFMNSSISVQLWSINLLPIGRILESSSLFSFCTLLFLSMQIGSVSAGIIFLRTLWISCGWHSNILSERSYIHETFWDNPFSIFGSCWDDWGPNRFLEDL